MTNACPSRAGVGATVEDVAAPVVVVLPEPDDEHAAPSSRTASAASDLRTGTEQAELPEDRAGVEVDALARDEIAVEQEQGDHPAAELPTGRRPALEPTGVAAQEFQLDP